MDQNDNYLEEGYNSKQEFIVSVKKVTGPREHKVKGSFGVYDSYKWTRKNKWLNIGRPITEHEFYSIIRKVNNYLADSLLYGHSIVFPKRMGELELRKGPTSVSLVNGKIKNNMPIDWDQTLKLWYEDAEAFKNKTLVRLRETELFKVVYNRIRATYKNKAFYNFKLNRDLKVRIKKKIRSGTLDAFKLW